MTTEHETPLIRAVDDDEDQLISLEALLSGEGWDVAAYTSARDFFVNDRPSRPGCLILDLRMPDVSGLEVQAEMKKRGITLPIIFLTGHGDIDTAVFAIRAGAEEFLQKPVQPDRLLTTVARSVQKDCDSREHPIDEAERKSRFGRLTTREREIIRLAAKGLLNRQIVPVRKDEEAFFHVGSDALLIYIQRLRTADGQPIFLENLFLPYEPYKNLMSENLNDVSMFDAIERISGLRPATAGRQRIEAVRATAEQAQLLNLSLGEPLLYLNAYFHDQYDHPLCIGRQYYIGSRYMFEF